MPYLQKSWRRIGALKWLSRLLCLFGRHYWFYSTQGRHPIICVTCAKKTEHYKPDAY